MRARGIIVKYTLSQITRILLLREELPSLAWLLAFTKSFAWVVCCVVSVFTPLEKSLQQAAHDFGWTCARYIIRYYRDNDVIFIAWKKLMPSKTNFTRLISGQVVLFPDNETWMIFKIETISHCFHNILRTDCRWLTLAKKAYLLRFPFWPFK